MNPHPDRARMESRLAALGSHGHPAPEMALFRFINPNYSKRLDIVDGAGGLLAEGRWNLKGIARLSYTAQNPQTALSEALAHVNYYRLPTKNALPRVLVALRLKAQRVIDLRKGDTRRILRLSLDTIQTLDWRAENRKNREAATQAWGFTFARAGLEAAIVPSAADPAGSNVLVFPENLLAGSLFELEEEV